MALYQILNRTVIRYPKPDVSDYKIKYFGKLILVPSRKLYVRAGVGVVYARTMRMENNRT